MEERHDFEGHVFSEGIRAVVSVGTLTGRTNVRVNLRRRNGSEEGRVIGHWTAKERLAVGRGVGRRVRRGEGGRRMTDTPWNEPIRLTIGRIAGIDVVIAGGRVTARRDSRPLVRGFVVPDYGTSIDTLAERPGFKLGWGETEDFEILYFYDRDDGCFGYALNVTDPDLSEWGYADFCGEEDE